MEEAIKALYSIILAETIATASEVQGVKNWKASAWQILMHTLLSVSCQVSDKFGTWDTC
jgi:hypothetical protein